MWRVTLLYFVGSTAPVSVSGWPLVVCPVHVRVRPVNLKPLTRRPSLDPVRARAAFHAWPAEAPKGAELECSTPWWVVRWRAFGASQKVCKHPTKLFGPHAFASCPGSVLQTGSNDAKVCLMFLRLHPFGAYVPKPRLPFSNRLARVAKPFHTGKTIAYHPKPSPSV